MLGFALGCFSTRPHHAQQASPTQRERTAMLPAMMPQCRVFNFSAEEGEWKTGEEQTQGLFPMLPDLRAHVNGEINALTLVTVTIILPTGLLGVAL